MSGELGGLRLAWDVWRAGRGSRPGVDARQRARLADVVAFARAHSVFYRERYAGLPTADINLTDLPPVTKPQLMARFDDWVTDPAVTLAGIRDFVASPALIGRWYQGRYLVWTTSGSTGEPAVLVQDRQALAVYAALTYVRALLAWLSPGDLRRIVRHGARGAGLLTIGAHYGGIVLAQSRLRARSWRQRYLRIFSVLTPLPELVRALNAFQPAFLAGYPTVFTLLAGEQQAGRLSIEPAIVTTAGELLSPVARQHIASALHCRVRDAYGASEGVAIAFDCGHGWLHVNADWIILEPVDGAYRPVPPGQPSSTALLTNLVNRVQPIIRYDLGDSVTVSPEPCSCGSPLPAIRVEGRTNEMLALRAPSGETVRLPPLAVTTVVEQTPGMQRFQVIQTGAARLMVRLEAVPSADVEQVWVAAEQRLRAYLAAQGLPNALVERAAEPPRRDPHGGKFRQVWAQMGPTP